MMRVFVFAFLLASCASVSSPRYSVSRGSAGPATSVAYNQDGSASEQVDRSGCNSDNLACTADDQGQQEPRHKSNIPRLLWRGALILCIIGAIGILHPW